MIDFSHANSSKQFKKQMDVCADVCQQIAGGEKAIIGVMVESHLVEGNQSLESGEPLAYGKSITDAWHRLGRYRCSVTSTGECSKSASRVRFNCRMRRQSGVSDESPQA